MATNSQLAAIAAKIRKLGATAQDGPIGVWYEVGRLVQEAIRLGAFPGIEYIMFRDAFTPRFYPTSKDIPPHGMLQFALKELAEQRKIPGGDMFLPGTVFYSGKYARENFPVLADLIESFGGEEAASAGKPAAGGTEAGQDASNAEPAWPDDAVNITVRILNAVATVLQDRSDKWLKADKSNDMEQPRLRVSRFHAAFSDLDKDLKRYNYYGALGWLKKFHPGLFVEVYTQMDLFSKDLVRQQYVLDHHLDSAELDPNARRVSEVSNLLRRVANDIQAAAGGKHKKPRIDAKEANLRARDALKGKPPKGRKRWSCRSLAKAIGCSLGLVPDLPAWQTYAEEHGLKIGGKGRAPKAVSLTAETLAKEDAQAVQERLRLAEIQRLAADQIAEGEADRKQYRRRRKV